MLMLKISQYLPLDIQFSSPFRPSSDLLHQLPITNPLRSASISLLHSSGNTLRPINLYSWRSWSCRLEFHHSMPLRHICSRTSMVCMDPTRSSKSVRTIFTDVGSWRAYSCFLWTAEGALFDKECTHATKCLIMDA